MGLFVISSASEMQIGMWELHHNGGNRGLHWSDSRQRELGGEAREATEGRVGKSRTSDFEVAERSRFRKCDIYHTVWLLWFSH